MLDIKLKKWISDVVGVLTKDEELVLVKAQQHFKESGKEDLSKSAFNSVHGKEKQKLLGITYTPLDIRQELTKTVLTKLLESKSAKELKVSDPCCGSGAFSITLIEELNKLGVDRLEALKSNVFFYDIDKLSVALSMINISEHLARHNIDATKVNPNAKVIDFLRCKEQFDAFITNPPYVKLQNLDLDIREYLKDTYPSLFTGALGLSAIFLKKMFDDLKVNGVVGVITQNNFFTSNSGVSLREEIQNQIYRIDTFGSEAIFEGVTAYTCLMYLTKEVQKDFEYRKITGLGGFKEKPSKIKNKNLDSSKWRLGSKSELEDLVKLESEGTPLNVACRIWVGIATQFDKGFTVFKEGNDWIGTTPNDEKIVIESGVVKSLIRVADLTTPESIKDNDRGIIYPYDIISGKAVVLEETLFKKQFPKAYEFLLSWKDGLMGREKGRVDERDWYKWGRIQSMIPVKDKLLTKTFNRGPCFYFDESDSLFSNGYALTPAYDTYDLKFVQAVLNSSVFGYYAKLTSFEIEGEYQCYQKNFIERFCLPVVDRKEQADVLKNKNIDKFLVDYYGLNYKPESV